ncbi:DUF4411 family protein [Alcanivorax sp.]|uniref:DUF4411 family protein n=1 Tax=Alcanivorax sp. TaxID=1872427 RepID=UPI0025C72FDF|nr:DUF4411 family protein [Alcanivorax sp.]
MNEKSGKIYLLDANIVIHAHSLYYNMNRVPEFWSWLEHICANGNAKIPQEILSEIKGGKNAQHAQWSREDKVKEKILLDEEFDADLLNKVIEEGYAPDLNDLEIEKIAMDPILVSYALKDPVNRIVVSNETPKPSAQRANKKIPDICGVFDIQCCNVFSLINHLDFTTNWESSLP